MKNATQSSWGFLHRARYWGFWQSHELWEPPLPEITSYQIILLARDTHCPTAHGPFRSMASAALGQRNLFQIWKPCRHSLKASQDEGAAAHSHGAQ